MWCPKKVMPEGAWCPKKTPKRPEKRQAKHKNETNKYSGTGQIGRTNRLTTVFGHPLRAPFRAPVRAPFRSTLRTRAQTFGRHFGRREGWARGAPFPHPRTHGSAGPSLGKMRRTSMARADAGDPPDPLLEHPANDFTCFLVCIQMPLGVFELPARLHTPGDRAIMKTSETNNYPHSQERTG